MAIYLFTSKHDLRQSLEHFHTLRWMRLRNGLSTFSRHLMHTSTEFIGEISAPAISTSFDFHDLVKRRSSGMYRFMSRYYVDHYVLFLPWSLINWYTSPLLCHNTWSWCIQGQIPHDLTLLWEIKVNTQVLQCAAIDESLRIKYVTINRIFRSITILKIP